MGLLPLEFSDCILDSPYFRENLRAHEKQLDRTSYDIKGIIKDISEVLEAARVLCKAKKNLGKSLQDFRFDCIGTSLTDDEIIIANSFKEFARFLFSVEDEMERMLEHASDKFITPLVNFRKIHIGSVKKTKKDFDKQTSKYCSAADRYMNLSSKKEESLTEAAEVLRLEHRNLTTASLQYVYLMQIVQERKKFEFVESILSFIHSWSNVYKHGSCVSDDFANYKSDLRSRLQKSRINYSATIELYDDFKHKSISGMTEDPGSFNKMYTRQGYLYSQIGKKSNYKLGISSSWTKLYCQYQTQSKILTLIPYSQLVGKISSTETLRVTSCFIKGDSNEKFRFLVVGKDLSDSGNIVSHQLQALSDWERKQWVEALGGTWPGTRSHQRQRSDSHEDNLNSSAFLFLKDCLRELENRGLNEQGLYRVGGVLSKVKKLLDFGLNSQTGKEKPLILSDVKLWESKTLASAVKQYFRDLKTPLLTHALYSSFVTAAKNESESNRIRDIHELIRSLPETSKEMLSTLIRHLHKVSLHSSSNLMNASNLGVCFGPTLLKPKEESVASILDIKFCNAVIEILIENVDVFFPPNEDRSLRSVSLPKRTQSFSSALSHFSSNSLPDIMFDKRTRSKSHVLNPLNEMPKDSLMASLEMMTQLAADLPNCSSPLSRTPNDKKPPLPKSSLQKQYRQYSSPESSSSSLRKINISSSSEELPDCSKHSSQTRSIDSGMTNSISPELLEEEDSSSVDSGSSRSKYDNVQKNIYEDDDGDDEEDSDLSDHLILDSSDDEIKKEPENILYSSPNPFSIRHISSSSSTDKHSPKMILLQRMLSSGQTSNV